MRRAALLLVLLVAACGSGADEQPALSGAPTTTGTTMATLPPLPATGLVGAHGDGVAFWSIDGELLAELPGMTLSSSTKPGGPIFVYRYEPPTTYSPLYEVDRDTGALIEAPPQVDGPEVWPDLPPPPTPPGGVTPAGHWAWAVPPKPDTGVLLGLWSGECESLDAFFIEPDGTVRSVLGGDWWDEPSTSAAGWLPDGRALIEVAGDAACGTNSPTPGRYAVDAGTGERERVDLPSALIWG